MQSGFSPDQTDRLIKRDDIGGSHGLFSRSANCRKVLAGRCWRPDVADGTVQHVAEDARELAVADSVFSDAVDGSVRRLESQGL